MYGHLTIQSDEGINEMMYEPTIARLSGGASTTVRARLRDRKVVVEAGDPQLENRYHCQIE